MDNYEKEKKEVLSSVLCVSTEVEVEESVSTFQKDILNIVDLVFREDYDKSTTTLCYW